VNDPVEIRYPDYSDAVALHVDLMQQMGEGYYGVMSPALLASALERPRMAAQYEEADLIRQAAHLVWGLLKNHPFNQGNKRTAVALAFSFLERHGLAVVAERDDTVELGYRIEDGGWDVDRVEAWLRQHAVPRPNAEG
jgi:death-on-curing protein